MPVRHIDLPQGRPRDADDSAEHCILEIAQGKKQALADLYEQTRSAVYSYALSILKNRADAEDVLQDTYLQLWQSAGSYRPQGKPLAWMFTIARNLAFMRLREQKRLAPAEPQDWSEVFAGETPEVCENRLTLRLLMETLSDEERQIVVLHIVAGLRHREIAALLKRSLPAVLSRYSRAMKKLRNAWEEAEKNDKR
ncbi:MAG: RNA polymerase sigma factor [Lachnospiraceae bacterium]|jgi:RNA polymerase sigma factor (sigma-70 family)|nr:RNA polymerase sigma factor [Lachnospiraceae bacterium]